MIGTPLSSVCTVCRYVCMYVVEIFKHLLRNHWANQSQISYRASMGWGNEILFNWSRSHDQSGHHAHIWPLEPKHRWPGNLVCSIGCSSTIKSVQMVTLGLPWLILRKVKFGSLCFCMGKRLNNWIFRNYCILWCQSWQMITWSYMNINGQGHSLTLVQCHSDSTFKKNP